MKLEEKNLKLVSEETGGKEKPAVDQLVKNLGPKSPLQGKEGAFIYKQTEGNLIQIEILQQKLREEVEILEALKNKLFKFGHTEKDIDLDLSFKLRTSEKEVRDYKIAKVDYGLKKETIKELKDLLFMVEHNKIN